MSPSEQFPLDEIRTQVTLPTGGSNESEPLESQLGDLRIESHVASGLSSDIYRATNLLAGKVCAVNVMRRNLNISPVIWGRYCHLARQISQLGSPHIAEFYGAGVSAGGRYYAVFEWISGQSLEALLRRHGPLSRRAIVPIVEGIVAGLAPVHAAGLAHRTLHAANVMVATERQDGATQVKLLDFAIDALHPTLGDRDATLPLGDGYSHISPERAKGLGADARSDVFALAALIYRMVCGQGPFTCGSAAELHDALQTREPASLQSLAAVSAELDGAILRGLSKDPRKRTPSVQALLSALDPVAATTGRHQALARTSTQEYLQLAQPAGEAPAGRRPATATSKRLVWIGVALGGALALFAGALIWSLTDSEPKQPTAPKRRRPPALRQRPQRAPRPRSPLPAKAPQARTQGAPTEPTTPAPGAAQDEPKSGTKVRGGLTEHRLLPGVQMAPTRLLRKNLQRMRVPNRVLGTVRFVDPSADLMVWIDGKPAGNAAAQRLRHLPVGTHTFEFQRGTHRSPPRLVTIKAGAVFDIKP